MSEQDDLNWVKHQLSLSTKINQLLEYKHTIISSDDNNNNYDYYDDDIDFNTMKDNIFHQSHLDITIENLINRRERLHFLFQEENEWEDEMDWNNDDPTELLITDINALKEIQSESTKIISNRYRKEANKQSKYWNLLIDSVIIWYEEIVPEQCQLYRSPNECHLMIISLHSISQKHMI